MYYINWVHLFPSLLAMPKVDYSTPNVGMLRMWYTVLTILVQLLSTMLLLLIVITELNSTYQKAVT